VNPLSRFLLAGLSLSLLSACSRHEPAGVAATETALAVSTVAVSSERLPLTLEVPATELNLSKRSSKKIRKKTGATFEMPIRISPPKAREKKESLV
jgi:hypothetical protein